MAIAFIGSYSMILDLSEKWQHARLQGFIIHQKTITFMGYYSTILYFTEKQQHARLQVFIIHLKPITSMGSYSTILYFCENSHMQDCKGSPDWGFLVQLSAAGWLKHSLQK